MSKRPLKERIGQLISPELVKQPEPEVSVPETDSAKNLAVAAESGFAAIQALFAERNKSVELAQSLHRHNVYLQNINVSLRAEVLHARQERDYYMKLNERIKSWVGNAYDMLARVGNELGHTAVIVEGMEAPPLPTNNPVVPSIDTVGRPVEDASVDELREVSNEGPPPVTPDELRALAARFANGSGTVASR